MNRIITSVKYETIPTSMFDTAYFESLATTRLDFFRDPTWKKFANTFICKEIHIIGIEQKVECGHMDILIDTTNFGPMPIAHHYTLEIGNELIVYAGESLSLSLHWLRPFKTKDGKRLKLQVLLYGDTVRPIE